MKKNNALVPHNPEKALQRIRKELEITNNLLNRIDKKNEITEKKIVCPRCLGKGFVDWDDIKRLGNVGFWAPGKCAYCRATGSVSEQRLHEVEPNDPSLFWHDSLES